jgi:acetyl-CoA carboxylase carboxyl transferase subunit beta
MRGDPMKELFRRAPKAFTPGEQTPTPDTPDNMWVKCPACGDLTYIKQLRDNLKVCRCGHHMRLSAVEWQGLFDQGSFVEMDGTITPLDPLKFVSPKDNYAQKLRESQQLTGLYDAMIGGGASIMGQPLQVTISEFEFIGGSMGSVFGEKIARAAERAYELRVPLLTINASGGARMHEGVISLMQLPKVNLALARLGSIGMPHISLMTDPCYGGVLASYASVADIIIAEPGARIGFAGRRVIEQTIRQKLPANFQSAEFMLEHGMIDMVVARTELRSTLARLFKLYTNHSMPATPIPADV